MRIKTFFLAFCFFYLPPVLASSDEEDYDDFAIEKRCDLWGKKVLVIGDMQEKLRVAYAEELEEYILDKIEESKKRGDIILYTEFLGYGSALSSLVESTIDYDFGYILGKRERSSYEALKNFFSKVGISSIPEMRVCGINTGEGVHKTVVDLLKASRNPNPGGLEIALVTLLERGCGTYCDPFLCDKTCPIECEISQNHCMDMLITDGAPYKNFRIQYEKDSSVSFFRPFERASSFKGSIYDSFVDRGDYEGLRERHQSYPTNSVERRYGSVLILRKLLYDRDLSEFNNFLAQEKAEGDEVIYKYGIAFYKKYADFLDFHRKSEEEEAESYK
jgi:hypothetical protein